MCWAAHEIEKVLISQLRLRRLRKVQNDKIKNNLGTDYRGRGDNMKRFLKKYWIVCVAIFFIAVPFLLNFGLFVTDIIYEKYGVTLTASGLQNQDWLDFWGTYLSVVIAFLGICMAWKFAADDRRKDKNEKLAQTYGEDLKEEENIIIEVCQSFDTYIIYKAVIELDNSQTKEGKRVLQNAREKVLNAQVKFELLTDIADNFQKCVGCDFDPCYDKENMIAIRDLYYEMESLYLQMLKESDLYVNNLEKQWIDKNRIHINEDLLKQKIQYAQACNGDASTVGVKMWENEIVQIELENDDLKKQWIKDEEIQKALSSIVEKANTISQNMKPQMIHYCKSYIDCKKKHKKELLQKGQMQYIKCIKGEDKQA